MRENFEMLQKELPNKVAEINRFVEEDTARVNQLLQKNGLSPVVTGRTVELPK